MLANKRNFPIRSTILQLRELQYRPHPDQGRIRTEPIASNGTQYLRGAPQVFEFRLRSARSHRETAVRARPCDPAIARVRHCRWDFRSYLGTESSVMARSSSSSSGTPKLSRSLLMAVW